MTHIREIKDIDTSTIDKEALNGIMLMHCMGLSYNEMKRHYTWIFDEKSQIKIKEYIDKFERA